MDITLPNTIATGVTSAQDVAENLFQYNWPSNNFGVMNGMLDQRNMAGGWTLAREHMKPGQFLRPQGTGQTANLDFFPEWFTGAWPSAGGVGVNNGALRAIPVPGACKTFYTPYPCSGLYLSWHIDLVSDDQLNDSADPVGPPATATYNTLVYLFINGVWLRPWTRRMRAPNYLYRWFNAGPPPVMAHYQDARHYNGAFMADQTELDNFGLTMPTGLSPLHQGMHTAGIYVAHKNDQQVRFRTRHFIAIPIL